MFKRKAGYAKLRGKAAELMGLGPALLALWEFNMDKRNKIHKVIRLCLAQNVKMEAILQDHKPSDGFLALPLDVAAEFKSVAFSMAQLNVQLCDHFATTEHNIFTVTAKTHMLCHIALLAHVIHPRLTWCFSGEDYMKRVQRLVSACCVGRPGPARMMQTVAEHYRLGLHLGFNAIEKQHVSSLE